KNGYDRILITHGNGPQVGRIFLQQELSKKEFPRQTPLDVCVADSQGRIGYILQSAFDNTCAAAGIPKRAVTVVTQVVVDPEDPAFQAPSKPIGGFYTEEEARKLRQEKKWVIREDAGRGYRRVIPSPHPLEIVEIPIFQELLDRRIVAIGAGGGGIPVVRGPEDRFEGVEAVIDKDRTGALLAAQVGLDIFISLTQVDCVYLHYNQSGQTPIFTARASEMETWLEAGHFLEGSMKPKVESALFFLKQGGQKAVIAHLNDLVPALEGKRGTQIFPD
ncbi:MAG: carbamate kinase, partial [Nitrospinaceae bacterium]|nr:carbamate kinase [Nitrospinaceae bacterium]